MFPDKVAHEVFGKIEKEEWTLINRGSGSAVSSFTKNLPDNRLYKGSPLSFGEYFNKILFDEDDTANGNSTCCSNSKVLDQDAPKAITELGEILTCLSTEYRYQEQLGMLYRLFCACRASKVRKCNAEECVDRWDELNRVIPVCDLWGGFKDWVLQVAACICARRTTTLSFKNSSYRPCELPRTVISICTTPKGLSPTQEHSYTIKGDDDQEAEGKVKLKDLFMEWENRIDTFQVVRALTWLEGIATGKYVNTPLPCTINSEPSGPALLSSVIDRAKRVLLNGKLCAHRVYAIAECFPSENKDWVFPALVPDSIAKLPNQDGHETCSQGHCIRAVENSTNIGQIHECKEGLCNTVIFETELVDEAVENNGPCTAWYRDGTRLVDTSRGETFMAISHVWADGTGAGSLPAGEVNECLFKYFQSYADERGCDGIWWDTICVPTNKALRAKALNAMHDNYRSAKVTLIHDKYLRRCSVGDNRDYAALAIALSPWFSRGWTALELAKCNTEVVVVFKNGLFDLHKDILAQPGVPSSLPHQVASTAIQTLRREVVTLNDLLTALGPRRTSWEKDVPIIAGLLADVPLGDYEAVGIYQRIVRKFKRIPYQHLFHNLETMSDNKWCWCPSKLLQMPKVVGREDLLAKVDIMDNGDAVGFWKVVEINSVTAREIQVNQNSDTEVQKAIKQKHTDYLLLLDVYAEEANQGVLVKVKDSRRMDIHCKFLGLVKLNTNLEPRNFGSVKITIGDTGGMNDLSNESAMEYVRRVWELRQGKKNARLQIGPKRVGDGW